MTYPLISFSFDTAVSSSLWHTHLILILQSLGLIYLSTQGMYGKRLVAQFKYKQIVVRVCVCVYVLSHVNVCSLCIVRGSVVYTTGVYFV